MSFHETKTLQDKDSKVRIDVESMARIELSDIHYIIKKIRLEKDSRLQRILYESAITKTASVYQLALKACKYLNIDSKKEINDKYPKKSHKGISAIATFRDNFFHDGISFIEKEIYYPFGKISGRGFVAIYIVKDARFEVKNIFTFGAKDREFAITSEGVFEVHNSGSKDENWIKIDDIPYIMTCNYKKIDHILLSAIKDLEEIWYGLSLKRRDGDGEHEYAYLNEGGSLELIENSNEKQTVYKAKQKKLVITGTSTMTPVDSIKIEKNRIVYE